MPTDDPHALDEIIRERLDAALAERLRAEFDKLIGPTPDPKPGGWLTWQPSHEARAVTVEDLRAAFERSYSEPVQQHRHVIQPGGRHCLDCGLDVVALRAVIESTIAEQLARPRSITELLRP